MFLVFNLLEKPLVSRVNLSMLIRIVPCAVGSGQTAQGATQRHWEFVDIIYIIRILFDFLGKLLLFFN